MLGRQSRLGCRRLDALVAADQQNAKTVCLGVAARSWKPADLLRFAGKRFWGSGPRLGKATSAGRTIVRASSIHSPNGTLVNANGSTVNIGWSSRDG
jgi:hypothetical protein